MYSQINIPSPRPNSTFKIMNSLNAKSSDSRDSLIWYRLEEQSRAGSTAALNVSITQTHVDTYHGV